MTACIVSRLVIGMYESVWVMSNDSNDDSWLSNYWYTVRYGCLWTFATLVLHICTSNIPRSWVMSAWVNSRLSIEPRSSHTEAYDPTFLSRSICLAHSSHHAFVGWLKVVRNAKRVLLGIIIRWCFRRCSPSWVRFTFFWMISMNSSNSQ